MIAKNEYKLLLVEDNPGDARLIREMLLDDPVHQFQTTEADTIKAAKELLDQEGFDIILLDLNLPDSQGENTFSSINNTYPDIPIVILTGKKDEQAAFSAIGLGAQDYLTKGTIHNGMLTRAILYAVERKRLQNMISHLALHDALTGLPNRRLLMEYLTRDIELAKRENENMAVMLLDLDNFKDVNDSFGHHIGDLVLIKIADRLRYLLRKCDIIARIGGDEFIIPVLNLKDNQDAEVVALKIIHAFKQPISIENYTIPVSMSIGIALYPEHSSDLQALIKMADKAMYQAKAKGKGKFMIYQDIE